MSDTKEWRSPYMGTGFSIPVEERIRFYYSLGYSATAIARVVSSEYQEFELNPITPDSITSYIRKNLESLKLAQKTTIEEIRRKNGERLQENFVVAQHAEFSIVSAYSKKIIELVEQLDKLDLSEKSKDGHFINMGPYATLVMAINKTQEMLEKLSGTAAAREVMTHMKKAYVKEVAAKGVGMHKAAAEMEVTFMDDPNEMERFGPGFQIKGLPELRKPK